MRTITHAIDTRPFFLPSVLFSLPFSERKSGLGTRLPHTLHSLHSHPSNTPYPHTSSLFIPLKQVLHDIVEHAECHIRWPGQFDYLLHFILIICINLVTYREEGESYQVLLRGWFLLYILLRLRLAFPNTTITGCKGTGSQYDATLM